MKRGRPKSKSKTASLNSPITEREKKNIERMISKGIFEEAKRAEQFGLHPGYVSIKLRLSLYNAMNQREARLPGKDIALLVSSIEEIDGLMRLIESTIKRWIRGEIVP